MAEVKAWRRVLIGTIDPWLDHWQRSRMDTQLARARLKEITRKEMDLSDGNDND